MRRCSANRLQCRIQNCNDTRRVFICEFFFYWIHGHFVNCSASFKPRLFLMNRFKTLKSIQAYLSCCCWHQVVNNDQELHRSIIEVIKSSSHEMKGNTFRFIRLFLGISLLTSPFGSRTWLEIRTIRCYAVGSKSSLIHYIEYSRHLNPASRHLLLC